MSTLLPRAANGKSHLSIRVIDLASDIFLLILAFLPGSGMSIEPKEVQAENVDITFYGLPETAIPAGGFIQLLVPNDIQAYDEGLSCYNVSLF